jgi:hypothetical protein
MVWTALKPEAGVAMAGDAANIARVARVPPKISSLLFIALSLFALGTDWVGGCDWSG